MNKDQQLRELLKVKRFERPNREFWDDFDVSFQKKLMHLASRKITIKDIYYKTFNTFKLPIFQFAGAGALILAISFITADNHYGFIKKNQINQIAQKKHKSQEKLMGLHQTYCNNAATSKSLGLQLQVGTLSSQGFTLHQK